MSVFASNPLAEHVIVLVVSVPTIAVVNLIIPWLWPYATVIEIYSWKILANVVFNTLDASFWKEAYKETHRLHGVPGITNTDQGSQFTYDAFVAAVTESGAMLSMDGKGAWTDNIFIERFWRSLKYEEVYLKAYDSLADATRSISKYIEN